MSGIGHLRARVALPTTEGFAALSDHVRLPSRFASRFSAAGR
ncbi:hypothetical protein [Aurantimonas sp. Leaf443]|nr:hypothetical protein [Aurantimonas sp. Leaf443]